MKRFLLLSGLVFAMGALIAEPALSAVNPPGNERRSMGNLRNTERPNPNSGSTLHQPWAYGNPPHYRRPPTTPYYVVPQPVYPSPYYRYRGYAHPYGAYRYQSYPLTPHPWGPRIHYPAPYWAY